GANALFADLFLGPRYVLRGFRLIGRPGLRRFFLIPLCINIFVFVALIWLAVAHYASLTEWLLPFEDTWWVLIARKFLWLLFALTVGIVLFFSFSLVANLIAAPFNERLAQRVEQVLGGAGDRPGDIQPVAVSNAWGSFANELRKLAYFIAVLTIALIMTLIPLLNLIAPFVWIVVGCWMLALEYLAYPMENHAMSFAQVRHAARARRALTLSFGAGVMAATLVPGVNLAVMPASVAGATAMWLDRWRRHVPQD
ncbi:MAG: sulfate transporter CysZ, partial [Acidiferrobacterales bacterium]|nr:sulfate transporter CysZ [Acidiferrobacterales bacterium]